MTKRFTDEEFLAADPLRELMGLGNDDDYLSMRNISYSITHSHKNNTILLSQRFTKSKVNMDGFSEEEPHQASIIIPLNELQNIAMELLASGMCLTVAEIEGDHHEGE
jgi:hypothetical protein